MPRAAPGLAARSEGTLPHTVDVWDKGGGLLVEQAPKEWAILVYPVVDQ